MDDDAARMIFAECAVVYVCVFIVFTHYIFVRLNKFKKTGLYFDLFVDIKNAIMTGKEEKTKIKYEDN